MAESIELEAVSSVEAVEALDRMLSCLQAALRSAIAGGKGAAEDPVFWAHLDQAYAAYDDYLRVVTTAHPPRCVRGCDACCHDNPRGVAGVEQLRVLRAIDANGQRDVVRQDVAEAARTYAAARLASGDLAAAEAQRALYRPCPLLGANASCTVYAVRPVACRMFHAFTPPEWCTPTHGRYAERQNPNLVPPLVCLQILGAISQCLGRLASTNLWEGLAQEMARE